MDGKIANYLLNALCITLSANLMIIPIMAYSFSTFSLTFWISNILAAPIMEIATIFGFLVYFVSILFLPFAKFLGIFLNVFLWILLKIAELSSLLPGSSIYIKTPYLLQCIAYYCILFFFFYFEQIKQKIVQHPKLLKAFYTKRSYLLSFWTRNKRQILATFLCLCISLSFLLIAFPNNLRIYFVDVGQGDCTLIQTPQNKTILIDGGGSEFGSFDVGESTLLPYLLDRRITTIDYMLISHFDSDHIGGLFSIMQNLKIKHILITKQGEESANFTKFLEIVAEKDIEVMVVKKGDYIPVDQYSYFEILFPEDELIQENVLNNNSMVAKFHSWNFTMLFTGDIEEKAEERLCQLYASTNGLEAFALKVAHHGSKTSSTKAFLECVEPKMAFIGVGENNHFGHPDDEVIKRLETLRCQYLSNG